MSYSLTVNDTMSQRLCVIKTYYILTVNNTKLSFLTVNGTKLSVLTVNGTKALLVLVSTYERSEPPAPELRICMRNFPDKLSEIFLNKCKKKAPWIARSLITERKH